MGNQKLKDISDSILSYKNKLSKSIKEVRSLTRIKTDVKLPDTVKVPFVDSLQFRKFADSIESKCPEVIQYLKENTIGIGSKVALDSPYLKFKGHLTKSGLIIDSLNLPNTQTIVKEVTKGGFFKRG